MSLSELITKEIKKKYKTEREFCRKIRIYEEKYYYCKAHNSYTKSLLKLIGDELGLDLVKYCNVAKNKRPYKVLEKNEE